VPTLTGGVFSGTFSGTLLFAPDLVTTITVEDGNFYGTFVP
jgi:hypothetical protein